MFRFKYHQLKKILVIQTASIGDVILVTPLLERLHKSYPEASIDLLVKKGMESLFIAHPFLGKVFVWNKSERKLSHLYDILKDVQAERYDLVVNVQRFLLTGLFTAFSRARHTVGFNKNPMSFLFGKRVKHRIGEKQIHEVDRNLELVNHLTGKAQRRPRLYPSAQDDALTSQYKTHKYICLAPASLWPTKQFPAEKWSQLMHKLPDEMYVYCIGSSSDIQLCEEIIKQSGHQNSINLAGKLKLLETASLMRDARMNFVNDSAPMHLASAVNAPVTAIFCSTVPSFGFGPLSDEAAIIEFEEELTCRPCGLHGVKECPEKHFKCAMGIDINKLAQRVP